MNRSLRAAILFIALACVFADGGAVLLRKQTERFIITVFGTPQVGVSDISVLVQSAVDRNPVLDATVWLQIEHLRLEATHKQATNKLLYAARMKLSGAGKSRLRVSIEDLGKSESVEGEIDVAPQTLPVVSYWPYFALVPAAVFLFILNQLLKNRRNIRRVGGQP